MSNEQSSTILIELLELFRESHPPGKGARHNITLNEEGEPVLALAIGKTNRRTKFQYVQLEEEDLEKDASELHSEIKKLIQ
jgi:hypothetical protein